MMADPVGTAIEVRVMSRRMTEVGLRVMLRMARANRRHCMSPGAVEVACGISSLTGSVGCSRCNTPECDHILPRENLSRRNQGVELSETSLTSSDLVTRTGRVVKTSQ